MEGHSAARPEERDLVGLAADALTIARLVVAVALIPVLGARRVTLGAVLLGCAWISDFLDGRAARASAGRTRLGDVDLWADTFVGAGAVLGFTLSGWIPPALGLGLVGLLLAAFALRCSAADLRAEDLGDRKLALAAEDLCQGPTYDSGREEQHREGRGRAMTTCGSWEASTRRSC